MPDKTNEIGAASAFLLTLALERRVVTADALLTQREFAGTILASGGDYLLVVKENQPTLHAESRPASSPAPTTRGSSAAPPPSTSTAGGSSAAP